MRSQDFWRLNIRAVLALAVMLLAVLVLAPWAVAKPNEEHPFEIEPGSFSLTPSSYQAGAHANWTTTLNFAHTENSEERTYNDPKDTVVDLPAGFMGNANKFSFPTCTDAQLEKTFASQTECPIDSQVGTITLDLHVAHKVARDKFPIYNMEVTSFGVTAEYGFNAIGFVTQIFPIFVRPEDSGIRFTSPSIQDTGEPHAISVTIWGVPAAHEHDAERGQICEETGKEGVVECNFGGHESKVDAAPLLANPTSCEKAFTATAKADSWEEPQAQSWLLGPFEPGASGPLVASAQIGPFTGCESVHFDPSLKVQATTSHVESPSGLNVSLDVPQTWEEPYTFATSNLLATSVTLPRGYTINPSAGNGIVGCTRVQYAAETASSSPGEGCPPESKLGKVAIETPVLAEKITGNVYLAQPYDNPFSEPNHPNGSLLAMYMVAKAPDRGIIVKAAGKVTLDPNTGRITATFPNLPQQPFSKVTFELTQGQTSPLVSPKLCGRYTGLAELVPSSTPSEPRYSSDSLQIDEGIGGGPCPSGGVPPFTPTVIAGTQNNAAGSYSPFYLRIARNDGEQEITKFSTVMPPGLTGNLTGVPFCSDAQIQHAREATGADELAHSSCPAASEVGHSLVGAGVGTILAWNPGKVYLAGTYHGAPLSLVSVTSATVGPFDLGTVVIRFALRINPTTAQVEVDSTGSDPIPHILPPGIVVHVRDIHVYIDRPSFMINPTSCNPMSISNAVTGAGADIASPTDDQTVNTTTRFQAADCANLKFKPSFKVSTSSKPTRKNGESLDVKLSIPSAPQGTMANIAKVKVDLPRQLPSRLETLQKACVDSVFQTNPAACPVPSRVGTASATTPILPVPLNGPVYFVSHGARKFPDLVIVLQGYGITVDLRGETFISKKGLTSTTFRTIPDVPVGKFELRLPQGPYSALFFNGKVCNVKHGLTMPTSLVAQNGTTIHQKTKIAVPGCRKRHGKRRAHNGRHRKSRVAHKKK